MAQSTSTCTMPAITAAQIKMIHSLKNALGLNKDRALWQEILYTRFDVISSKELGKQQASSLIDEMQSKAVALGLWKMREDNRQKFNHLADRPNMASPAQLRKIEAIWQEISRAPAGKDRTVALRAFINRIAEVSDIRFLTSAGAGKVLNALKTMQSREKRTAVSPGRSKHTKRAE